MNFNQRNQPDFAVGDSVTIEKNTSECKHFDKFVGKTYKVLKISGGRYLLATPNENKSLKESLWLPTELRKAAASEKAKK